VSHAMVPSLRQEQLKRCWKACWHRARRPVEGVLVTEEQASLIAEQAIRNVAIDYSAFPSEAEFTARALEEAAEATRRLVAEQRRADRDPQVHHDPSDRRYAQNLDLDRLQHRDAADGFNDREWNRLPDLLRPLALATLGRKGIRGPDAEEVFNDTLVELARERESDHRAPILDPTVFEEIIPLHTRIVSFRAVDWYRRRSALKNQPNNGESFDALTDDPDRPVQFEDPHSDPGSTTFEQIYKECREALTSDEWELIFTLYVGQSVTIGELIEDPSFCRRFGIKTKASSSTKRRILNELIQVALEKIRKNLAF